MAATYNGYSPKRVLEQIKGISEAKATKFLTEGRTEPSLMSIID